MNDLILMPDEFKFYNNCTESCDMVFGPCICGAWHKLSDWPKEVLVKIENYSNLNNPVYIEKIKDKINKRKN